MPAAVLRGVPEVLVDEPLESAPTRTRPRAHRPRRLVRLRPGRGRARGARHRAGQPGGARRSAWRRPAGDTRLDAVSRAVRAALHGVESGTADVGRLSVTLGADSPYELGQLVARLRAALWCEWLVGARPRAPSADGLSVVVHVSGSASGEPSTAPGAVLSRR